MEKLIAASRQTDIKEIAIAGGVSANSGLREAIHTASEKYGWKTFLPKLEYSTDNAAMIAIAGYFKYLDKNFASQNVTPYSRSLAK
jgi:N6-L-threonylcarbamoyladenine synthase